MREMVHVACDVHPTGLRRKYLVAVGHYGVRGAAWLALQGNLYVISKVTLLERRLELVAVLFNER